MRRSAPRALPPMQPGPTLPAIPLTPEPLSTLRINGMSVILSDYKLFAMGDLFWDVGPIEYEVTFEGCGHSHM